MNQPLKEDTLTQKGKSFESINEITTKVEDVYYNPQQKENSKKEFLLQMGNNNFQINYNKNNTNDTVGLFMTGNGNENRQNSDKFYMDKRVYDKDYGFGNMNIQRSNSRYSMNNFQI